MDTLGAVHYCATAFDSHNDGDQWRQRGYQARARSTSLSRRRVGRLRLGGSIREPARSARQVNEAKFSWFDVKAILIAGVGRIPRLPF